MSEGTADLDVHLSDQRVGTLTRLRDGDRTIFTFDDAYLADSDRPVLSLQFKAKDGTVIDSQKSYHTRVPPFFAGLLPEGALRNMVARQLGTKPERDFPLLVALGEDLPGAVVVSETGATRESARPFGDAPTAGAMTGAHRIKFSLAGVQLKLSAVRDAKGGLTLPMQGHGGDWIVKLPSEHHAQVPENEAAMMQLARHAGMDVPETFLAPLEEIAGLPPGLQSAAQAFVTRRYDRRDGQRLHAEDFTQVFGLWPEQKYEKMSYGNIARVVWSETGEAGLREFVARLVFNAAIGNGDMHGKNWSLTYPDGRHAALAPGYDFVSTLPYMPGDTMALGLAGTKHFGEVTEARLRRFAEKASLPEEVVMTAARDAADATARAWADLRQSLAITDSFKSIIDANMRTVPIIATAGPFARHPKAGGGDAPGQPESQGSEFGL